MYKIFYDNCYTRTKNYAKSAFVLRAVSDFAGQNSCNIQIEYTVSGKPIVLSPQGIYISVSHSEAVAVTAVSDAPVGIDIERIREFSPLILKKFTDEERRYIQSGCTERFFEVWCAKEAILKLSGKGLSGGLSSFCVCEEGQLSCKIGQILLEVKTVDDICLAVATQTIKRE